MAESALECGMVILIIDGKLVVWVNGDSTLNYRVWLSKLNCLILSQFGMQPKPHWFAIGLDCCITSSATVKFLIAHGPDVATSTPIALSCESCAPPQLGKYLSKNRNGLLNASFAPRTKGLLCPCFGGTVNASTCMPTRIKTRPLPLLGEFRIAQCTLLVVHVLRTLSLLQLALQLLQSTPSLL